MKTRLATAADFDTVLALRQALCDELGFRMTAAERAGLSAADRNFFAAHLESLDYRSWLAESAGQALGLATLAVFVRPPYLGNLSGREAYLLNMYTVPAQRGSGVARAVLDAALQDARQLGCKKVFLHASEAGRPLYLKLGFKPSDSYLELL